jgi:hypothetical protein
MRGALDTVGRARRSIASARRYAAERSARWVSAEGSGLMAIEQSHGKARPVLPRSSDLAPVEAERNPLEGRSEAGHFAAGNRLGVGARWKASIKKLLGKAADETIAKAVGADATRVYLAVLRSMPSDAAPVRSLVALHARHIAVAAYFTDRAAAVGLDTEQGLAFLQVASNHGQRAERTAVTALDVATKLAKGSDAKPLDLGLALAKGKR